MPLSKFNGIFTEKATKIFLKFVWNPKSSLVAKAILRKSMTAGITLSINN